MDSPMETDDSDEEMFLITPEEQTSGFVYNDPLLVSGTLRAVLEENLDKLKEMVMEGKSLNINDNNGNTPLHLAVIKNNLIILNYLVVQDDIIINTRNFMGQTPLFIAVKSGCFEASKILISQGANVNLPDNEDVTPLHRSVNNPELTRLLITNGANVDAVDYNDDSPLHDAISEKYLETVCMLLYYDADANAVGGNGLTPFMKAIICADLDILDAVIDYVDDYKAATFDGVSTVMLAFGNKHPYLEKIIQKGADVDDQVFLECIENPNVDLFKVIWTNMTTDCLEYPGVGLFTLYAELFTRDFEQYIDVIVTYPTSDEVLQIMAEKINSDHLALFFNKCIRDDFVSCDRITKLACLLLQHGLEIATEFIDTVFYKLGQYSELFTILMFMDYKPDWNPFVVTPRLIFDLYCDVKKKCTELLVADDDELDVQKLREDVICALSFWKYRPLLHATISGFVNSVSKSNFENNEDAILRYYELLSGVPSLLQLARDKTRTHIVNRMKFKTTCQYYTFINTSSLPFDFKNMLSFRRKIY